MKADILIIDGRHLLYRTYDAFKNLYVEYEDGKVIGTGGIYGFLNVLIKIYNRYGGLVVVAWEGKDNFRYKLYPDYKKKKYPPDEDRLEIIEDMRQQEKRLKAILRAAGIRQYYGVECEADDVMGRLAFITRNKITFIYTGDSDLRQLVTNKTFVVSPGYKKNGDVFYDEEAVEEKHGVIPFCISDLKALAGDSSDNIPGVKGIGDKTAMKLIVAYENIEGVINAAKKVSKEILVSEKWPVSVRFIESIVDSADDIRLFKKLTTINKKVKIKLIEPKRNLEMVRKHFKAYNFVSLTVANELNALMRMSQK